MPRSEMGRVFAVLQKIVDSLSSGDLQAVVVSGMSGDLTLSCEYRLNESPLMRIQNGHVL
ncbi:hypothetical protein SAMN05421803_12912 [Nocardiopsis flavescens]|uniref:Uncharacterized protein n=1 Tax=Nocardiopsis flavescens TaxID=758803 RepID=A0A1M6UP74_9ACTN|nr:hypothetical protein SAMN05421803_12912 [Nocardiopsis flavescens]